MTDAIYIINNMFCGIWNPIEYIGEGIGFLSITKPGVLIIVFELAVLVMIDVLQARGSIYELMNKTPKLLRHCIYVAFLMMIVLLSAKGTVSEFIYFQF